MHTGMPGVYLIFAFIVFSLITFASKFRKLKELVFGVACIGLALWLGGFHLRTHPTADELYGCTMAQQVPNGDCP